jgi:hypothetical protein
MSDTDKLPNMCMKANSFLTIIVPNKNIHLTEKEKVDNSEVFASIF